jgi:hypothetical protein
MSAAFFSFSETDREAVLLIKGRAVNPRYSALDFHVQDLLSRWDTTSPAVIRQAISKSIYGTSRTIVFVGRDTHQSRWVPEEVNMTLESGKSVYAIALHSYAVVPSYLSQRGITVHDWSDAVLQWLATR